MTTNQIHQFLILYNAATGHVEVEDLGEDADAAASRYAVAEDEYRERQEYEVVLIGADSLETIRTTHAHYFDLEKGVTTSVESRLITAAGG